MERGIVMRFAMALGVIAAFGASATLFATNEGSEAKMFPEVEKYLQLRSGEFDQIPSERKVQLEKIAVFVKKHLESKQSAKLTFICTHNSRRSQMAQIWATTAARHFGIEGVETFSGGTEATAFNPRAVAAMERAGFKIEKDGDSKNPRYSVRCRASDSPLICFSKIYTGSPNPKDGFCAVMTCSQADKSCPIVSGCSLRIALPYDDPKVGDGSPEEARLYDERCVQIGREMLFLFARVRTQ
jgi:arsenate reductase